MLNIKLSDANIVITDKVMLDIYKSELIDSSTCNIISSDSIFKLNLYSNAKEILDFSKKLADYFFLIGGSSNFHHVDIANINRIQLKIKKKIQLILFDHHMDCGIYKPETNLLHCGNWISYAYQTNLVNRVVMIGTKDFRKETGFDYNLEKKKDLLYHPFLDKYFSNKFLNPNSPTYISIDTDILKDSSDWERGSYSLQTVLKSPIWEQLSNFNLVGACIIGHVTDNRKFFDLIKTSFQNIDKYQTKYDLNELWQYLIYTIFPKIWSSMFIRPLPTSEQFKIILSFYKKIQSIR